MNPSHPAHHYTARCFACAEMRHMDCLVKLLDLGANIQDDMVQLLLECGADPNA